MMNLLRSFIQSVRAFLGLYSLVTGGMAVLTLVVAFLIFVFLPELRFFVRIVAIIAALLLVLFVIGAYSQVRSTVLARQTRYGTNTGVMAVAFLGIAILINVISVENHQRIDVTASGQYTLSRQTITVLKNLKDSVKVTGFVTNSPISRNTQGRADNLLTEYRFQTGKISFEFVDPEKKPGIANRYDVRNFPVLVFESGERLEQVFGVNEQDFTGAILKVTGTRQLRVYFLIGHGEHDTQSADGRGFSQARAGVEADNYAVRMLSLGTIDEMPPEAALVIIANPVRPFLEQEVRLLDQYLVAGGKALFMVNPNPLPQIKELLEKWGIQLKDGIVVDEGINVGGEVITPAVLDNQYLFPDIASGLAASFFPGAAGIEIEVPEDDENHVTVFPLAITSPFSFLETDPTTYEFDADLDLAGPFPLAVVVVADKPIGQRVDTDASSRAIEDPPITQLVVFADSDFATNENFYSVGNSDLFLNSVNWLTSQEELISIRPKPPEFRRLVITQRAWNFILYSTVAFWPLAVLLAGGVAWWRRR